MPSKVYSAAVVGVDAFEVEIEVHAGWGPDGKIAVVGLPDTAVKESRDRALIFQLRSRCCNCTSKTGFRNWITAISAESWRFPVNCGQSEASWRSHWKHANGAGNVSSSRIRMWQ